MRRSAEVPAGSNGGPDKDSADSSRRYVWGPSEDGPFLHGISVVRSKPEECIKNRKKFVQSDEIIFKGFKLLEDSTIISVMKRVSKEMRGKIG